MERDHALEKIVYDQWHADVVGGAVAQEQLKITDRKLAVLKMTRADPRYVAEYERARKDVA